MKRPALILTPPTQPTSPLLPSPLDPHHSKQLQDELAKHNVTLHIINLAAGQNISEQVARSLVKL